jgi:hypothetical protein
MPSSSAITNDGISPAMSVTASHSPRSITASMISAASSSMRNRSASAARGVNWLLMMRRSRV